ncbi:MAG: DUF721 domain-containing protein [Alphaproteobacteria bacterium]|nr:DUF721 domain-containing protein [Alphaproteobacteria bacterium]
MQTSASRRRVFPRTLAECIEPVAKPALGRFGAVHARLIRDWEQVAGAALAAHAEPESLSFPRASSADGTLTLRVSAAFALEVQHMEPVILERLAVYFGYRAITRIRLRQCAAASRVPASSGPACTPPAPNLPAMEDDALRAALCRLGQALQSPRS